MNRKPRGYWNNENNIIELASKCTTKFEFREKYPQGYRKACETGLLKSLVFENDSAINKDKYHIVYCYKDEENKSVYVGLTKKIKIRHRQHKNGNHSKGKVQYDTVYKYFHSINKDIPEPIILKTGLTPSEAQYYEEYYVEMFKKQGYKTLNIAKTGSLGGGYVFHTKEIVFETSQKYKTKREFKLGDQYDYNVAVLYGWIDDWFPENVCKKPVIQYDLNGIFIREFKSISEASRYLNGCYTNISNCCRGRSKTAYGYIWKYKDVA